MSASRCRSIIAKIWEVYLIANVQMGKALKARLRIERKTVATLGEGSLFSHLNQQLSGDLAKLEAHMETVTATGGIQESESLSIGPEITVLSCG